jgi:hypothetical protein
MFAPCYSQSPPPADFTSPYGILGLEISTARAESRCGLSFVYILIILIYINIITIFLVVTINRFALKGGKPYRKPYHPFVPEL